MVVAVAVDLHFDPAEGQRSYTPEARWGHVEGMVAAEDTGKQKEEDRDGSVEGAWVVLSMPT